MSKEWWYFNVLQHLPSLLGKAQNVTLAAPKNYHIWHQWVAGLANSWDADLWRGLSSGILARYLQKVLLTSKNWDAQTKKLSFFQPLQIPSAKRKIVLRLDWWTLFQPFSLDHSTTLPLSPLVQAMASNGVFIHFCYPIFGSGFCPGQYSSMHLLVLLLLLLISEHL